MLRSFQALASEPDAPIKQQVTNTKLLSRGLQP